MRRPLEVLRESRAALEAAATTPLTHHKLAQYAKAITLAVEASSLEPIPHLERTAMEYVIFASEKIKRVAQAMHSPMPEPPREPKLPEERQEDPVNRAFDDYYNELRGAYVRGKTEDSFGMQGWVKGV